MQTGVLCAIYYLRCNGPLWAWAGGEIKELMGLFLCAMTAILSTKNCCKTQSNYGVYIVTTLHGNEAWSQIREMSLSWGQLE
jgi:hypothetical protein